MGLKTAIQNLTLGQKLAVVAIAVIIPIGAWMGLGFPTDKAALGLLGASEAASVVASIEAVFGVTPP